MRWDGANRDRRHRTLPVQAFAGHVQPRRGAFTEVVERTGGGVLVEPDDPTQLADAFMTLWSDRTRLGALGQRAFDGVRTHYAIERSADRLVDVYRDVVARSAGPAGVRR